MLSWKSKDVRGDGSCFYRALFTSAKNYHSGSLVKNIYDCFGIHPEDLDSEEEFVLSIRKSLADKIESNFYDQMVEQQRRNIRNNASIGSERARREQIESTIGFYENLINWARKRRDNASDDTYTYIVEELPREFRNKFENHKDLLETTKKDFYKFVADLIRRKEVYASEYDISIVKFILEKCRTPIFLNMIHNKDNCKREKNGVKTLNVQRVNENHYISWIEGEENSNSESEEESNSSNKNNNSKNSSNNNSNNNNNNSSSSSKSNRSNRTKKNNENSSRGKNRKVTLKNLMRRRKEFEASRKKELNDLKFERLEI